jgi:hypothetical protein
MAPEIGHQWPSGHFPQEGDDVQKKTCVLAGLAVAATGGVLLSGSPAHAQSDLVQGHRHHHYRHYSSNRNTNWNRNHNRVVVRVNVHNSNHNVAVADREREDEDFGFFRHRGCGSRCGFERDGFRGRDDDDRDEGGDRIIVGNDIRSLGARD